MSTMNQIDDLAGFNSLNISRPTIRKKSFQRATRELSRITGSPNSDIQSWITAEVLEPHRRSYKDISLYIENGKCHPHIRMKMTKVYKISLVNQPSFYNKDPLLPRTSKGHRMMLWHGTKVNRVAGILQNGFVRPTTAGQMYGNGVYFADRVSKSAQFCGSTTSGNKGYIFLCDVHLGKVYKAHHGHNEFTAPPVGFDSVKGNGKHIPNWKENRKYYGSIMPVGTTKNNSRHETYDLDYNEYIVYDLDRIRPEFLVEVVFW